MSIPQPIQDKWIFDLSIISHWKKGREIISNGWNAVFIKKTISLGTSSLEHLNPFSFADPLSEASEPREVFVRVNKKVDPFFASSKYIEYETDADSQWVAVNDGESHNNIFDALDNMWTKVISDSHCVKIIRSYSGPYSVRIPENTD